MINLATSFQRNTDWPKGGATSSVCSSVTSDISDTAAPILTKCEGMMHLATALQHLQHYIYWLKGGGALHHLFFSHV